ncbi:SufS family cysteine desulfurase [Aliiglaciecola sp. M165]|uniref:SufS family cysteine desulfurase n=1 Tax=Aliiglaciecola sp. M165 TaxID=2593649 RepID=UPI00117D4946|nr:SufS family cysteine desulfurase [Aliiglaciecola sp. M165]TRY32580.1 SufS family cysteine desulfurase [Aliiglaciecola sp. M165]
MKDTSLRTFFPFFEQSQNSSIIYFDNAATTHKPQCVIDAIQDFYLHKNANVHRSSFSLASNTTNEFEQARRNISTFLNASCAEQIVFTKGATESINLVAKALADADIEEGGRILLSATEHHANLVPWQQLAQKKKLFLDIIPVDKKGIWDVAKGLTLLNEKTCVVALGMVSNALGSIQPIEAFLKKAKLMGALTLVDAAQAVAHMTIDVNALDCDFLAFSSHKMYGPTGVGVLYGKKAALEKLPIFLSGGEMIEKVSFKDASFQIAPFKFEAGTPNIEGVFGLNAAINFICEHRQLITDHEARLIAHLRQKVTQFEDLVVYGDTNKSISTLSFRVDGYHSQDIAILLNEQNIALRVGHHCVMPLMDSLGISGTLRISLACYNTIEEIDFFVNALENVLAQIQSSELSNQAVVKQNTKHAPNSIAETLLAARGWDAVYRQIMLAGKQLQRLDASLKTPQNEVFGCESQVWLKATLHSNQTMSFEADATGKIVRGLLAILIEPIQNQPKIFIAQFDFKKYIEHLSLSQHLSDSRGNGIMAVVKTIHSLAQ